MPKVAVGIENAWLKSRILDSGMIDGDWDGQHGNIGGAFVVVQAMISCLTIVSKQATKARLRDMPP